LEKERSEERKIPGPIVLVYRCINNKQALRYTQEFFNIKICNYNLRGSGTLLMLPDFNLKDGATDNFRPPSFAILHPLSLEELRIF